MAKIINRIRFAIISGTIICNLVFVAGRPALAQPGLKQLYWLEGVWMRLPIKDAHQLEIWKIDRDGSLRGFGCRVEDTDTITHENMKIMATAAGLVFMVDVPHYARPVSFLLRQKKGTNWIFENPDHPFPSRISYRRQGRGRMLCTSEGGGRTVLVYYQRHTSK
jgi:hypothetical protein